ncbi:MAG: uronase [Aestuariibaculum sp.]
MKKPKTMLLISLFLSIFMSCNDEELFVSNSNEEENSIDKVSSVSALINAQPGETLVIGTVLDLEGRTINLASNINLIHSDEGEIINGSLNFADSSTISGELLNSSLSIVGSLPALKSTSFNFSPSRWGIVEGKTTSAIARKNTDILIDIMQKVKDFGIKEFVIDKMDAYFEISSKQSDIYRSHINGILIPSDFYLKMSDNTHLRVHPNSSSHYSLITIFDVENVTIEGGNLHGDRDEHNYSSGGTHEWGHCLLIRSGINITVKDMKISSGSGDGIDINSIGYFYTNSNYKPSRNITITGNTLDSNRRNNISITDGRYITIENNTLLNASINTSKSTGIAPGYAVDIEAGIRRNESTGAILIDRATGKILVHEIAENIIIRENTEKNSRKGALTVHVGNNIDILNNTFQNHISYSFGYNINISGNTITATDKFTGTSAIVAGRPGTEADVFNYSNKVTNNVITGYPTGITFNNTDLNVTNNKINDFTKGFFLLATTCSNITISDNILKSKKDKSIGFHFYRTSLDNINISNNEIDVLTAPVKLDEVNNKTGQEKYNFTFENNIFTSSNSSVTLINKASGVTLRGNNFNSGLKLLTTKNIILQSNTITSSGDGIYFRLNNENILLENNIIDVPSRFKCVKTLSSTIFKDLTDTNTTCK